MTFMDIEKAYPRVCRPALWKVLARRGCPREMVNICKALHQYTAYKVKYMGAIPQTWMPLPGLREGCPSSPPLFNVYHDAVMQDFRVRRKRKAEELNRTSGLRWTYCVDGRISKRGCARRQKVGDTGFASGKKSLVLGDVGFADDIAITGILEEMVVAEETVESVKSLI